MFEKTVTICVLQKAWLQNVLPSATRVMFSQDHKPAGLPDDVSEYKKKEYWDDRYEKEDSYEWFTGYRSFNHLLTQYVKKTDKLLMLGCGNSPLSADMYKDGFHHITNIDYSGACIDKMKAKHRADMPHMAWMEMDARQLQFEDGSFDVVLEKGMLDALMVEERSPWSVSDETRQSIDQVLTEVSRVLCTGGHFISITFAQPHFRTPLYAQPRYGWSLSRDVLGGTFHFFCYAMTKGGELTQEQIDCAEKFFGPRVVSESEVLKCDDDAESEIELFFQNLDSLFVSQQGL